MRSQRRGRDQDRGGIGERGKYRAWEDNKTGSGGRNGSDQEEEVEIKEKEDKIEEKGGGRGGERE